MTISEPVFVYSASRPIPPGGIGHPNTVQAGGNVQVAFSPGGGITPMIVALLDAAEQSVVHIHQLID
jgi:hypothetical protein